MEYKISQYRRLLLHVDFILVARHKNLHSRDTSFAHCHSNCAPCKRSIDLSFHDILFSMCDRFLCAMDAIIVEFNSSGLAKQPE